MEQNQSQTKSANELAALLQAAVAEKTQLLALLEKRSRQQALVATLSQRGLSEMSLAQSMDETVAAIAQGLDVQDCGIFEYFPQTQTLHLQAGLQSLDTQEQTLPRLCHPQIRYTLQQNQPVIASDLRTETRFQPEEWLGDRGWISSISVLIPQTQNCEFNCDRPLNPVPNPQQTPQVYGVLIAYSQEVQAFTPEDSDFLQAIAHILATSIEQRQSRNQQNLFAQALKVSQNSIFITDATQSDNPIIYVNPSFEKITGYSAVASLGRNCRFLQGNANNQPGLNDLRTAIAQSKVCDVVLQNYRSDGTAFWNKLHITPVRDATGNITNFIGVQTDITEQKQATQERDRFFSLSLDMLCICGFDGYFKRLNPAWEKVLGFQHQELLAVPFIEFVHPDDRPATLAHFQNLITNTDTITFENRYCSATGLYKWLSWTGTPSPEDGLIYIVAHDITQHKRAEIELQRTHQQIGNVLESITDAFYALDRQWRFTYVNPAAEELLQRQREDLIGKKIWNEFPEAVNSVFYNEYHHAIRAQVAVKFEAFYAPLEKWFNVHAYPAVDGMAVYFNDLTQRKQIEANIRYSLALEESLAKISKWFVASPEVPFHPILQELGNTLGVDRAYIIQFYGKNSLTERLYEWCSLPNHCNQLQVFETSESESLNWWIHQLRNTERIAIADVELLPGTAKCEKSILRSRQTRAAIAVPIKLSQGNLWGFIGLEDTTKCREWSDEESRVLRMVSEMLASYLAKIAAEEALRASEERYRQIVETSSEGIWVLDIQENTIFVNPRISKMLGYTADELLGNSIFSFVESGSHAIAQQHLQQCRQGQEGHNELLFCCKNKQTLWATITTNPIFDALGEYAGAIGMITNITERKQAEIALLQKTTAEKLMNAIATRIRQSLNLNAILTTTVEQVRQFLNVDRVLIYQFDPDGSGVVVVESVNPKFREIRGTILVDNCFVQSYAQKYQAGKILAISDIEKTSLSQCYTDLLAHFQVKANLVVPILIGSGGQDEEIEKRSQQNSIHSDQILEKNQSSEEPASEDLPELWGLLIAHHCESIREWQTLEIDLLKQLATQLAIAIQQSSLFAQVQNLNNALTDQVNERTAQLQEALEFSAVLQRIIDRVRDSLDENQILETAVQELAHVLPVDYCCAAIYDSDRTAATIRYEYTQPTLGSALGQVILMADAPKIYNQLLAGDYFESYWRERTQYFQSHQFGSLACPILKEELPAKLLCPICDDRAVLGHLGVFRRTSDHFSATEIHLIQQVANHCAIALRQARLYQASLAQVEELERLNRLKDEFLSTVSHELRTPMANMKMAIQMLEICYQQSNLNGPAIAANSKPDATSSNSQSSANSWNRSTPIATRLARYLQILHDECEREIDLINDLLDLQRLELGKRALNLETIHLPTWIMQIIAPFQERAQNRQQHLTIHLDPRLSSFVCETVSLERILAELLQNACKYTPPQAEIQLSVAPVNTTMQFRVTNFGVEIPNSELNRIFEKFYRIPSADPWKQGGTGLGLALVKKLVDHLGATIHVESAAGQTCFTVQLPLVVNKDEGS